MFFMVVTLDVSKPSGWLNASASCRESKGGHTIREAWGDCGASDTHGEGPTQGWGPGHAHVEHALHGCDAGGVEAYWLVELSSFLSSRKEDIRCRARCGVRRRGCGTAHWDGGRGRRKRHARGGADKAGGQGTRGERTQNMRSMVVTPEVSHLDMSALNFPKFQKSELMSVMSEVSQSAIGPHFVVAVVGLAL